MVEAMAGGVPVVGQDLPDIDPDRPGGEGLAAAIARLAAVDPAGHASSPTGGLELVYTRSALDDR